LKIDVFFTIPQVKDDLLIGSDVVLIDVLRSTTTICYALSEGALRVLPVADQGEATSFVEVLDRDKLVLGGEKDGRPIQGFDLGNSPLEYNEANVGGRNVVLRTSNGTQALKRMRHLPGVLITAFVNLSAVVKRLLESERDLVICCAGSRDQFCLEDSVCAGMLVKRLQAGLSGREIELNDAALVGRILYDRYKDDLHQCLKQSTHGRFLSSLNQCRDLEYCAEADALDLLPIFVKDQITLNPIVREAPESAE
jgi:2-phosphosulfolactate phosphatase